jgi:glycine cleavage system aminomethyltransferase T
MSCNNVNTTGATSPSSAEIDFYLSVAKGDFTGYSNVSKFGYNPTTGSGGFESIWGGSNAYPWPTDVQTLSVVSASANDTSAGTGARTVEIQGLDTNWDVVTDTVTMNGTTPVVTTQTFRRVFRARVITAGSLQTNAAQITFTGSTDANILAYITYDTIGMGQTLMAVYTVPAGKTGYIININVSSAKDLENRYRLMTRDNTVTDAAWNVKEYLTGRGSFSDWRKYAINKVTEKTDMDLQILASATGSAAGGFELILIDN